MSALIQRRLLALGAIVVAGGILAYIAWGDIGENLVYFWDAKQLVEQGDSAIGARVRLGGVVQEGTVNWNQDILDLKFNLGVQPDSSADNVSVLVAARAAPPQMFREGIGVVVEGVYDGKTFNADRVLVKHSNEYQAPKKGEKPTDIYKTLIAD